MAQPPLVSLFSATRVAPARRLIFANPREATINEDESLLIARIVAGDREAYAALIQAHEAHLYGLCRAILGDAHEAQDAAQDSLIKAYRALGRFQGQASFRTWLTRIAINQCKDRLRARRRQGRPLGLDALMQDGRPLPAALVQAPLEMTQDPGLSAELMQDLSGPERSLVELLLQGEKMSYQDLGQRLGLSLDAVRGRLKRLREKLRRLRSMFKDQEG